MSRKFHTKANDASSASEQDVVEFKLVSCLLTAEELDQKCDELLSVIWNGANTNPDDSGIGITTTVPPTP